MACNFFTYEDRLNTFDKWPREHEVNRIYLANHGFYYVRSRSSVKCAFCNGMHRVSEVSDRILSDHRCQNPLCQFEPHPDRPEDDNFDNGDEVPKEGPMHPKYSSLTARMHSFENWPNQMSQTPVQCAGAGFVYTGMYNREVKISLRQRQRVRERNVCLLTSSFLVFFRGSYSLSL